MLNMAYMLLDCDSNFNGPARSEIFMVWQQVMHYFLIRIRMTEIQIVEKLVDSLKLKNGLKLKLYDGSRKLAGDRWLVTFIARIEIPVKKFWRPKTQSSEISLQEIRRQVNDTVIFEKKMERHFIDKKEKDDIFIRLKDSFLNSGMNYLSNPEFPEKFIMKKYKELSQKRKWYQS